MEEGSGEGLGGAFVVLLDAGGERVGAWLTDADGAFTLRPPGPGRFTIRVDRIGYASVEDTLPVLTAADTLARRIAVMPAPIALPSITVSGERRCVLRPGTAEPTRLLWEEARKALEIAVWAERQQRFRYDAVLFRRTLARRDLLVVEEERQLLRGLQGRPFASAPADTLLAEGFVRPEQDHLAYDGPDGRLLLSGAFLDTHCFRAATPPGPGLAALAFEPVERRELPDIRGTIALDAATARLRWIRFHYVGEDLPRSVDTERYGGSVTFQRLPSGAWIVSRWRIRFPSLATRSRRSRITDRRAWRGARLMAFQETEGAVTSIITPSGTIVAADVDWATLTGTVLDRDGEPVSDAVVFLEGTQHGALTGPYGAFTIEGVPTGRYTVSVDHRLLRDRVPQREVDTSAGDTLDLGTLKIRLRRS